MAKQLLWPSVIVIALIAVAAVSLLAALLISTLPEASATTGPQAPPAELAADSLASPLPTNTDADTPSATPAETATETSTPSRTSPSTEIPPSPTPTSTATATRPTATPTRTLTPLPTRTPTQTPLPTGHSELQNNELASAAIVGNLDPKQNLPAEIGDCRWQQPDARIICHVQVFLPPGYFDGARRYPVLYLLHGWGGWDTRTHDSEWDLYKTFTIADNLMRAGQMPPLIIVVPEGGHNYWFNHAVDNQRWGDYVASEVVNYVDTSFRTIPRAASRAIGGLSMGGLGAIQLALNHPNEFSVVGMRSPTLRRIGDPDESAFFGDASYYANYDPFVLVNRSDTVKQLALYIIIGDKDMWLERTQEFRALLDAKQVRYDWHVYPGGHDGRFFGSRLDEELTFYGAHLATK